MHTNNQNSKMHDSNENILEYRAYKYDVHETF